jgi:predicted  nucleic acid-binding Zn-ribbon protein
MKYLKKYKVFFENLEVKDTDDEDVKASKKVLNELKDQLSDYNSKKSELENLFKRAFEELKKVDNFDSDGDKNFKEINDKLPDIIGKEKINPFLSELANINKIKWKIQKKHNQNAHDKVKVDDFSKDSQTVSDPSALNAKIAEINDRISIRSSEISDLEKELKEKETEWNTKIQEKEKYLQENIKKISDLD